MVEKTLEKIESLVISNKFLLILLVSVFVVRIPSLLEPLWYGDEAIYLTIGQEINRGSLLYVDIFDHKTPGIYYLAAWSLKLLGGAVWSFKFLLTLWIIPTLVAFYFLAKRFFDKRAAVFSVLTLAILTSIPILEGNIVNSEILMILPTSVAFILGLRKHYFAAGIFFSLALLLKFPAVFDFAAFFVFVALFVKKDNFVEVVKNLAFLVLGISLPFLLTFVYFATKGAFTDYLNAAFLFNLSYTSYGNEFIIPNGLLIVKALPLLAIVLYFFWRVLSKRGKKFGGKVGNSELLVIWLIFSYYGAVFGGRPYIHYLIQPLAPFAIIVGGTIASADFRRLGLSLISIIAVLSLLLGFSPFSKITDANLSYYTNFFKLVFNKISTEDYQNSFDSNTSRNYSVATFISGCSKFETDNECKGSRTSLEDTIYLWANQPSIYFLSDRKPATKYITAFHVLGSDSAKKHVMGDLRKGEPSYIIVDEKGPHPFPELDSFIQRRYNLFAVSESYAIYELNKKTTAF
jgi:4-amino-4-deoxy-L-arabinose transferase-like glycosyltransferase